jgi:small subunit ribosomal protein S6
MFIFDSNAYARDPNGVSAHVPKMVEDCGGDVLVSRLWNEQKLAYPIKGHRKGTYWLSYFKMEAGKLAQFRRACQLNEDVLRSLIVKIDPRLIEAVVAHAKGKKVGGTPDTVPGGPVGECEEGSEEAVEVGDAQGSDKG